jgi:hypothetical protein
MAGLSTAKPGLASLRVSLTLDRTADYGTPAASQAAIVARSAAVIPVMLPGGIALDHAATPGVTAAIAASSAMRLAKGRSAVTAAATHGERS